MIDLILMIQDYAVHGVNSLQAAHRTAPALADVMLTVGSNATLRIALGCAGRRQAELEHASPIVGRANGKIFR